MRQTTCMAVFPNRRLLYNALLKELCKIGLANLSSSIFCLNLSHIVLNHKLNKLLESGCHRIPTELCLSLSRITPKVDNVCRTVEVLANLNKVLANKLCRTFYTYTYLIKTFTLELELDTCMLERKVCELTNRVLNASSDNEVLRLVVLQYELYALYIVLSITPVTEAVEVAEIEAILLALSNTSSSKGNLTSYESLTTSL